MSHSSISSRYYIDAIKHFDGETRQVFGRKGTVGIFVTYPKDFVSNMTSFWEQVINSEVLTACHDSSAI